MARLSLWSFLVFSAVAVGCKQGPETKAQDAATRGPADPKDAEAEESAAQDSGDQQSESVSKLPAAPAIPESPAYLGAVEEPADNPTTPEKVQLGHMLFFDKRLSKDGSMACVNCHLPEKAWTDGNVTSVKVGGAKNKRNSPMMLNLGYHTTYYWDGRKPTLESVTEAAWMGQLGADPAEVATKLNGNETYKAYFERAFGSEATAKNIPQAFAAFLRTLKSGNSPWDKFEQGDQKAVSEDAKRGFEVFKASNCALCHVPPLYSDSDFHNMGVGFKAKKFADAGRMDATKEAKDEGAFKTPSLRDVALTGPYFHDGSVATLSKAVDLMAAGGVKNPKLDAKLKPVKLKPADKKALMAFLEALTGTYTFTKGPQLPP